MRSRFLMVLTCALVAAPALGTSINVRDSRSVESCNDIEFSFDDMPGVVAEQRLAVAGNTLAVRLGDGHGIPLRVDGTSRGGYEVLLCKAAEDPGTLAGVRLVQSGTELTVDGPAVGEWHGYLLVRAPRNGQLAIEASNGPVAVRDLAGELTATIANGPLSLREVGGRVNVTASNGPVSFRGSSGEVSISTANGPISIHLESTTWQGGELRTSATNGPVTLHVPAGYVSGILVERGARTPFRCPTDLCGERPEFFRDSETQIAIGSGATRIHVAAKNGPVSIKHAD